jgi:hypothetical protein
MPPAPAPVIDLRLIGRTRKLAVRSQAAPPDLLRQPA